jgi:hypothetical protein
VLAQLGSLLIENDQFDEAEPFLRRAVEEGKVPSAYGDLANVLWDIARRARQDRGGPRGGAQPCSRRRSSSRQLAKSTLDMLLDLHEEEKLEPPPACCCTAAEKHPQNATVLRYLASMYLDGDNPRGRPPLPRRRSSPSRAAASTTTPSRAARSSASTSPTSRTATTKPSTPSAAPTIQGQPPAPPSSSASSSPATRATGSPTCCSRSPSARPRATPPPSPT